MDGAVMASGRRLQAVSRHLALATEAGRVAAVESGPAELLVRGEIAPAEKDPSCDLSGCRLADSWTEHRLSSAERERFLREGYVLIDDCLSAQDISELTDALDWEHEVKTAEDQAAHDSAMPDAMNRMGIFTPANELSNQDALQRLVINEKVLPKIVDVLGWNISIYHAHANRSPPHVPGDAIRDGQFRPVAGESAERPPAGQEKTFAFHQDSGRVNKELETSDGIVPRLSVKAIAYLTDVEVDMGPTWIVPGSHKLTTDAFDALLPANGIGQPEGAIPVLAKAGQVLLFDRRLRHAATPNWSQSTRKAYFIGYAYRWLKPKDAMYTADILPTIDCAVTRQLLGDSWSNNGFCGPTEADAPLFVWMKEHGIDPASTGIDGIQGEGELTMKTPGRENYGRLQGDVGHLAWSTAGAVGGYKGTTLAREELEVMSKEQLVEWALANQR